MIDIEEAKLLIYQNVPEIQCSLIVELLDNLERENIMMKRTIELYRENSMLKSQLIQRLKQSKKSVDKRS